MNTIITILLIFNIILFTICYYQVKKVGKYEKVLQHQLNYIQNISLTLKESQEYLQGLDEKGTFKSDDEVGYFFDQLLKVQQELDKYILPTDYEE